MCYVVSYAQGKSFSYTQSAVTYLCSQKGRYIGHTKLFLAMHKYQRKPQTKPVVKYWENTQEVKLHRKDNDC